MMYVVFNVACQEKIGRDQWAQSRPRDASGLAS